MKAERRAERGPSRRASRFMIASAYQPALPPLHSTKDRRGKVDTLDEGREILFFPLKRFVNGTGRDPLPVLYVLRIPRALKRYGYAKALPLTLSRASELKQHHANCDRREGYHIARLLPNKVVFDPVWKRRRWLERKGHDICVAFQSDDKTYFG
ncbi:hypothetical protein L218DRAFT_191799 [Marasmius fiardii PR-910]|nr:hypothetical protein L218DRAFT_191799 [Marasmius fiardii PR-910]